MTVTVQGGPPDNEIWHVTRSVANAGPVGRVFHDQGLLAMSTPLPIMTISQGQGNQYVAGFQAQMCIKAQGNYAVGGPHFTTFIAVGDPWASQP